MPSLALARKWRPKNFMEVMGQPTTVTALSNALNTQQFHHATLLTGTRGVGKTSIARIIAKCLNCEQGVSANPCGVCSACVEIDQGRFIDLIEVDAASRTKVEDTRDLLENVPYAPTKGRTKIYLIDEVHMLSSHSFNALLKTLEEPPEHVKFLLATTDPQKLPATILSRCLRFHLMSVSPAVCAQHLEFILNQEKVPFDKDALLLIGQAAKGSLRDALSLLDQSIAYGNGSVKTDAVRHMLGCLDPASLEKILESLREQNVSLLLNALADIENQGGNHSQVLDDLLALLHDITVTQLTQTVPENTAVPANLIQGWANSFSREDIQLYYQIGLLGQRDLPLAPTPRIGLQMALMRMMAFHPHTAMAQQPTSPKAEKAAVKPAAQTQSAPAKATAVNTAKPLEQDWALLYTQLNLNGPSLALAQNCALLEQTENSLRLGIRAPHKALAQARHIEKIEAALLEQYGRPYRVQIDVVDTQMTTPSDQQQKTMDAQRSQAKQALEQDATVQELMRAFDASIIESSIKPSENSA